MSHPDETPDDPQLAQRALAPEGAALSAPPDRASAPRPSISEPAQPRADAPRPEPEPPPPSEARGALRVLVIEGDPQDLHDARDLLAEAQVGGAAGHEVLHAETLGKAMELLSQEPIDLVLLDVGAPGGLSTFDTVQRAAPDVPVVILSGVQDESLALETVRRGAQDFLLKGEVEPRALGRAVRYAVERNRYTDAMRGGHERFAQTLQESDVATLVLDPTGTVLFANPAAATLVAAEREALLGLRLGPPSPGPGRLSLELTDGPRGSLLGRTTETSWEGRPALLFTAGTFAQDGGGVAAVPAAASRFEGLRTASPAMRKLFATCERVAPTPASILLLGETGTGKELLARAIHRRSGRPGRFVPVNCAAIPANLIESELFGYEKGAFTGAQQSKPGLFRQADTGTLMLDEVGSLAMASQLSLLRTLQERMVRPVGATTEVPVDVRVIAATSAPLFQAVERGEFREDLLYRLDVIRIEVPPLRERPEDILHLFRHFCEELGKRYELGPPDVGQRFLEAMLDYPWPGNVRQLENFAERLLLTGTRDCITRRHFHELTRPYQPNPPGTTAAAPEAPHVAQAGPVDVSISLSEFLDRQELAYLEAVLETTHGHMQAAADRSGVDRRTMLRKLRKHGLDRSDFQ